MMKKIVAGFLAVAMVASLAACGQTAETPVEEKAEEEAEEVVEEEAPEVAVNSGVVTFAIDMTQYEAGKTVRAWIPLAQDDEYQTITDVVADAGDVEAQITEDALGNKMMYVEWDKDADPASRTATLSFHVDRCEIVCPELVESGDMPADLDQYLAGSEMVAVEDEAIVALAAEITEGKDTVLDKARAIYDWIYDNMVRDNDVIGCGQGDICTLINSKAGKCTDINSVFVGLCRASGIPAREMFGVRINADDITNNEHCWSQFYLPGTGWVQADPADVLKAILTNEWEKDNEEALAKKEFFWGNNDNLRVKLSEGRDLTLAPAQDGGALNDFGYPYAEVDGEVINFYAPAEFVYTISFVQD